MSTVRSRIIPILTLYLVIAMTYLAFRSLPDRTENRYDETLLHWLALTFGAWCVTMLIRTRLWSWLALAVLAAFTGDALFYAFISDWHPLLTRPDWLRLIRAAFAVSAAMLTIQAAYDVGLDLGAQWQRFTAWYRDRRRSRKAQPE